MERLEALLAHRLNQESGGKHVQPDVEKKV